MPVTSVKAPDGSIIKVNHPEGASREDIFEFALQQFQAKPGVPIPGEIPTAPTEEEVGQAPPAAGSGYSVGDALIGLRNMGVPDEAVSAIQALLSVSTGGLVEMPPEAVAAAETLLTLGTGAVGGTAGMLGGTVTEAGAQANQGQFGTPQAAQAIQEAAMRGAERLTYSPRTEMGRRLLGQVAEASEPLAQLPPVLPTAGLPGAAAATLPQRARMAQAAIPERRTAAPEAPVTPGFPSNPRATRAHTGPYRSWIWSSCGGRSRGCCGGDPPSWPGFCRSSTRTC